MGAMVEFPANGGTCHGYLAEPATPGPGLVVIQEWWGLVPHIKDVCDRFAAEGFLALAPDLYRGTATTEPDEAGKLMMSLNIAEAAKDMRGAAAYLAARSVGGAVGATGFCMGGAMTLVLAAQGALRAAVPFYGIPRADPGYANITCPVLGHYAEHDGIANAEGLFDTMRAAGVDATLHVYPGTNHAFFNDARPEVYEADAAHLAWQRTLAFLREHLT